MKNDHWPGLLKIAESSVYTEVVSIPGDSVYLNAQLTNLLHCICT